MKCVECPAAVVASLQVAVLGLLGCAMIVSLLWPALQPTHVTLDATQDGSEGHGCCHFGQTTVGVAADGAVVPLRKAYRPVTAMVMRVAFNMIVIMAALGSITIEATAIQEAADTLAAVFPLTSEAGDWLLLGINCAMGGAVPFSVGFWIWVTSPVLFLGGCILVLFALRVATGSVCAAGCVRQQRLVSYADISDGVLSLCCRSKALLSTSSERVKNRLISLLVVYFFLCYQAIIVAVAATWRFSPALTDGTFLSNDFSVMVFFPADSAALGRGAPTPQFVAMATASAIFGVTWGLIAPAVAVRWLFRHRKRLLEERVQDRFGLLLDGFKLGLQNDGLDFMLGRTSTLLASNLVTEVSVADLQRDLQDFLVIETPRGAARSRLVTIQQTLSSEALGKSSFRVRHMLTMFAEQMYAENSWWWPIFLLASRTALVLVNVATTNSLASRAFWGAVVVVSLALAHTLVQPYAAKAAGLAESLTLVTQSVAAILSLFFFAFDWDSPTIKSLTILGSFELQVVTAANSVARITAAMLIAGVTVMAGNAAVQLVMVAFNALRPGEAIVQEEQTQVVASETLSWWLSSLLSCLTCSERWTRLPEADPEANDASGDATVVYCFGPLQCKSQRRVWHWCALCCFCRCWCQRPEPLSGKSFLGTVTKAKLLSQYMVRHSKAEAGEVSLMFYNAGVAAASS